MKTIMTLFLVLVSWPAHAQTFVIHSPDDLQSGVISLNNPDESVKSLGSVSIRIDFAASHDTLFELTIRRQGLTLQDGRPITRFAYSLDDNLIVGSRSPVDHISIAGVEAEGSTRKALVLFHNASNEVIAPPPEDIAAFDLSYTRKAIRYQPLLRSTSLDIPVNIVLDSSGSMAGFMPHALSATRDFMGKLPDFTRCQVLTFNSNVMPLTSSQSDALKSCPDTRSVLTRSISPSGSTALFEALGEAFKGNSTRVGSVSNSIPKLVIVLTDGVNTKTSPYSVTELQRLKQEHNVRSFVFWIGNYSPQHLKGLADLEVVSSQDVIRELEGFFNSIGISVSGMQTLTLL